MSDKIAEVIFKEFLNLFESNCMNCSIQQSVAIR